MKNVLAEFYGEEKRWVNWKLETRGGKTTKLPYSPQTGKLASSTNGKTWATYEDAIKKFNQIGIVFTPEQDLLGIDIDHCVESGQVAHKDKKIIRALIEKADTYTELSPSGHGLHLYLALSAPLPLVANKRAPFEAYTSGRYFTTTNIPFGTIKDVRTVTPEEALEILAIAGYPWGKGDDVEDEDIDKAVRNMSAGLDDQAVLDKMFASKNGAAIKALYEGDTSAYKKDDSAADMALLSHLAFWTGKNAAQMEHVWILSPLGGRKKTQTREDYRTRSIQAAIRHCKEVYEPQPSRSGDNAEPMDEDGMDLLYVQIGKNKNYIQNTENMSRILQRHPKFKGTLRLDMFKGAMERRVSSSSGRSVWRTMEDSDAIDMQTQISVLFSNFRKVGKDMIFDAIAKVCKDNEYDSAADYIRSIKWDGKARLDTWLSVAFGAPEDELHAKIGSNWLKGLIKRIIVPGCKFDYVLVLEGEQGIRKSTSLGVLAGPQLGHVETTMSTDTKDFFLQFQGKAIVEFSEGETLSRTEVKRMKALITIQSDKFRPPYGRNSVDNPRRCVFAMTTNQTEYLKDETGNRRWLPVAVVGVADIQWIEENREQLFAEAYERVINKHETVYEFPEEEMIAAQHARRIHDPNAEIVADWYFNKLTVDQRRAGITIHQAHRDALNGGFQTKPMTRTEEMSMADILRATLMLRKEREMVERVRITRYYPTNKTEEVAEMAASTLEIF